MCHFSLDTTTVVTVFLMGSFRRKIWRRGGGVYTFFVLILHYRGIFDFSGKVHDRISLLDGHVKRSLSCLSNSSWTKLFNDCYRYVMEYFTKILQRHNCPAAMLNTFRSTWLYELFKDIIKLCVSGVVECNSYLTYRDSSTDSNKKKNSCSDSSSEEFEEFEFVQQTPSEI